MLDFFRKRASSWFAKLILGAIALIFALYFGFSGGGVPAGPTAPIAKVNGENIPSGAFNQAVENQMALYRQLGPQQNSSELQKAIQAQVLQRLITGELLAQTAHDLGLHITDQELAENIRNTPTFSQDGRFNEEFYLKEYKPYYENRFGQNFEYALREDLLKERLVQVFNQASVLSQLQIQDSLALQDTQLKIRKLEIPFGAEPPERNLESAKQIAQDWLQTRKSGQEDSTVLKEHELKVQEIGPTPLQTLLLQLGDQSLPILSCLLKLEAGQTCAEIFSTQDKVVVVELLDKTQQTSNELQNEQVNTQLTRTKQNRVLTGITKLLTRQAKIESFLGK